MKRRAERKVNIPLVFCLVGLCLLVGSVISFCVGKYPITMAEIGALITGGEVKDMTVKVFFSLRVPRTIMAIMGGMALGMAGAVYQNIFKNPLASPDIIGISSGANMGAAIAIVSVSGTMVSIAIGAFAGGLVAVLMVMVLVQATKSNATSTYVLAGIIISAVANAVIMLLKYYADSESELAAIEYWTMGSLASITASKVWAVLPFWVIGVVGLLLLHRQIGLLALNEEECRALGVRLRSIRITVLLLSTLLVASIICVTGLISFAGLIAPHIARMMIKRQNTQTLILSSLVGGGVLLISDILARTLYAAELPISILTTVIGVPILVWFMCKRKGEERV
ncbi:MAG: iron ABC transporter permease [Oscillospiraceae bacterium]|nr:iron ABC transporter permease [Oscillospiraceae bacterium]